MRASADQALKNWAVTVIKDMILVIPAKIDEKFNQPTPEHRLQRLSIRFKFLLYSLAEEAKSIPV